MFIGKYYCLFYEHVLSRSISYTKCITEQKDK
jgi:hypothetical protein